MTPSGATKWQDWAGFGLGLWLALSPWTLGYSAHDAATANAALVGLLLALGSHFGLSADLVAEGWLNLGAGLWLMMAPFALGFGTLPLASANCLAVGALTAVLAASAMSIDKEIQKWWHRRPAGR
jgi:hypothetical protein